MRKTLEKIIDCSISESSLHQAKLPIRLGGLGLREECRSSPAAYLSSCSLTRKLSCRLLFQSLQVISLCSNECMSIQFPGEQTAQDHLGCLLPNTTFEMGTTSQHQFQIMLDSNLYCSLKEFASIWDRARLNTVSSQHVSAWLRTISNSNLGLALPSKKFIVALWIWLRIPVFPSVPATKRCTCDAIIDKFGDHLLRYNQEQKVRIRRQNALREVIFNAVLVDYPCCRREMKRKSTCETRPGDDFHPDYEQGLPTYFDLTVGNSLYAFLPCQSSQSRRSSS